MRTGGSRAELVRLAGWRNVVALVVLELGVAVVPLAVIAVIGVLVGRVVDGAGLERMAVPLVGLGGLLLAHQLLAPLRAALAYRVTRHIDGVVRGRVAAAANLPTVLTPLEDPATLDRLVLAGGDIDHVSWPATPGGGLVAAVEMGGRYLQAVGAGVLLASVSLPIAVGLTGLMVALRRQSRRWNRVRIQAIRDHLTEGRAGRYTASLASTPLTAKETRLFGLLDWLLARHRGEWAGIRSVRLTTIRFWSRRMAALLFLLVPAGAAAFVALGRLALNGEIDARTLAVALQSAFLLGNLLDVRDESYQVDFGMEAYDELKALEANLGPAREPVVGESADGLPSRDIRFEGVRFVYPGGRKVFDGLDLVVPAGSSLAVVGANGVGKTTLVKLLSRLYEPDGGRILVDGLPLRALDVSSWRRRLAVIFQDFVHYELTVADNVRFGGISRAGDWAALEAAATNAGALTVVKRLPAQWDTPLGRQYENGAELSGGEWQRLALARALFAVEAGAGVLVLDEPTANLDVRAEAELFERFLDVTRGLTTILISHRFSTVRRAERICVLEEGRVVELGSHNELMGAGGRYSELFRLQAARFND